MPCITTEYFLHVVV